MKRLLALTIVCLSFCALCNAYYSPNTNQYEWVTSNSQSTDYFDKWDINPNRDSKTIVFNFLACYPEKNNHAIIKAVINYNTKTITWLEGKLYDDKTNALIKDLNGSEGFNSPKSYVGNDGQKWADKLIIYIQ